MLRPHYRGLVASPRQLPPLQGALYDIMMTDGEMYMDCTFSAEEGRGFVLPERNRCIVESDVHVYLLRQLPTP